MTQFLRDEGSDREEEITPLMLEGTYLSRATPPTRLFLRFDCGALLQQQHC